MGWVLAAQFKYVCEKKAIGIRYLELTGLSGRKDASLSKGNGGTDGPVMKWRISCVSRIILVQDGFIDAMPVREFVRLRRQDIE